MKWIKASERLPEIGWTGFFIYTDDDGRFNNAGKYIGGEGLWTGFVGQRGNYDHRLNKFIEWLDESGSEPEGKEQPEDLQKQVRDHINQHDLFDWHEALTENEMTYLENLLLTFCPLFPVGSIGFEKWKKYFGEPEGKEAVELWKEKYEAAEKLLAIMDKPSKYINKERYKKFQERLKIFQQLKNKIWKAEAK